MLFVVVWLVALVGLANAVQFQDSFVLSFEDFRPGSTHTQSLNSGYNLFLVIDDGIAQIYTDNVFLQTNGAQYSFTSWNNRISTSGELLPISAGPGSFQIVNNNPPIPANIAAYVYGIKQDPKYDNIPVYNVRTGYANLTMTHRGSGAMTILSGSTFYPTVPYEFDWGSSQTAGASVYSVPYAAVEDKYLIASIKGDQARKTVIYSIGPLLTVVFHDISPADTAEIVMQTVIPSSFHAPVFQMGPFIQMDQDLRFFVGTRVIVMSPGFISLDTDPYPFPRQSHVDYLMADVNNKMMNMVVEVSARSTDGETVVVGPRSYTTSTSEWFRFTSDRLPVNNGLDKKTGFLVRVTTTEGNVTPTPPSAATKNRTTRRSGPTY